MSMKKCSIRPLIAGLACLIALPLTSLAEDIAVGTLGSLKNPITKIITAEVQKGSEVYFAKLNAHGGINGRKIRLVFSDDGFTGPEGPKAARQLINTEGALILMNSEGAQVPLALSKEKILESSQIALVGPVTGATPVHEAANIFPVRQSYLQELELIFKNARSMSQKRLAVLYYNSGFGPPLAQVASQLVKVGSVANPAPLDIVASEGFDVTTDPVQLKSNIETAIQKIKASKPDGIIILAVGPSFPASIKTLNSVFGKAVSKYTWSPNNWEDLIKNVGFTEAVGVMFAQAIPYPFSLERQIVREYQEDMKKFAPNEKFSYFTLEGYLNARLVADALKKAGKNPTRASVLQALEAMGRVDLGGVVLNYSDKQKRVEDASDITIIGRGGSLIK